MTSQKTVNLNDYIFGKDQIIVICAVRYCLPRSTHAVIDCIEWLKLYWHTLKDHKKQLILEEIIDAVDSGETGTSEFTNEWIAFVEWARGKDD